MTPKIDQQISALRLIFQQLDQKIKDEKAQINSLKIELDHANEKILLMQNENDSLLKECNRLQGEIDSNKKQQVVEPDLFSGYSRNEAEIDALVKEIDYCIAQLKNNNG